MGITQEKPSLSRSRANAHVYTKGTLQLSWPICFLLFAGTAPTPEAEQTWGHGSARSHVGRGARGRRRAGMSLLALPCHMLAVTSSCPLGGQPQRTLCGHSGISSERTRTRDAASLYLRLTRTLRIVRHWSSRAALMSYFVSLLKDKLYWVDSPEVPFGSWRRTMNSHLQYDWHFS